MTMDIFEPTPALSGPTQVMLEGKSGTFTIDPKTSHLGTGGKGSAYALTIGSIDYALKFLHDMQEFIADGMPEKLELVRKTLNHPGLTIPGGLIIDPRTREKLGFYMPQVKGTPFSQVITPGWRNQNSFGVEEVKKTAEAIRQVFAYLHSKKVLATDPNENNWIIIPNKKDIVARMLDPDGLTIGRWKPRVVAPTVTDYTTMDISEATDIYGLAVLIYELFCLRHPFTGEYAPYANLQKDNPVAALQKRVVEGLSDFDPRVKKPKKIEKLMVEMNQTSPKLAGWLEAALTNKRERSFPPSPMEAGAFAPPAAVTQKSTTAGGGMQFIKILDNRKDPVIRVFNCGIVLHQSGMLTELREGEAPRKIGETVSLKSHVVRHPEGKGWLVVDPDAFTCNWIDSNLNTKPLRLPVQGHLMSYNGILYIAADSGMYGVKILFNQVMIDDTQSWPVVAKATQWFSEMGIMDNNGAKFMVVPYADGKVAIKRIPELDSVSVVAAERGDRFVAMIARDRSGLLRKLEFTFGDENYVRYQKPWSGTVQIPELNMAVRANGTVAVIPKDETLVVFNPTSDKWRNAPDKSVVVRTVTNHLISTEMQLASWENKLVYVEYGAVWQLTMQS